MAKKPKLRRAVFVEAARMIAEDEERFSCNAISRALGCYPTSTAWYENAERVAYNEIGLGMIGYFYDLDGEYKRKNCRVLALLFAAEALGAK